MRTDSVRVAAEAVEEARVHILESFGKEYVPATPPAYKAKKGQRVQDAHEAIRPTSVKRTPKSVKAFLKPDQYRLYELIWSRFLASQMADVVLDQTTVDITGGAYLFRLTGSLIVFRGFLQAYADAEEDNADEEVPDLIPESVREGLDLALEDVVPNQHFTKPPPRFTEATLVKELDGLGIGRPSTYAAIIFNILSRKYIEKVGRALQPTELGTTVCGILTRHFPDVFTVSFTSFMEDELDQIEAGTKEATRVLRDFYGPFGKALEQVVAQKDAIRTTLEERTSEVCEHCGKEMVIKWGRNGKFYACTGFPECKTTKPLEPVEPAPDIKEACPECGEPLAVKRGRFGQFIACTGYPKCKYTRSIGSGVACPRDACDGEVVERRSKKGKVFFGCSRYPKCDFVSWNRIVPEACPQCGHGYLEVRSTQKDGESHFCPKCKAKTPVPTNTN